MAKAKKKRAEKYDPPLKVEDGFGDVIKVAMTNPDKLKKSNMKYKKGDTVRWGAITEPYRVVATKEEENSIILSGFDYAIQKADGTNSKYESVFEGDIS